MFVDTPCALGTNHVGECTSAESAPIRVAIDSAPSIVLTDLPPEDVAKLEGGHTALRQVRSIFASGDASPEGMAKAVRVLAGALDDVLSVVW